MPSKGEAKIRRHFGAEVSADCVRNKGPLNASVDIPGRQVKNFHISRHCARAAIQLLVEFEVTSGHRDGGEFLLDAKARIGTKVFPVVLALK